jgi:hypothetical protein
MLLGGIAHVRAEEPVSGIPTMSDPMPEGNTLRTGPVPQSPLSEDKQNRFVNLVRNVHTRMDAAISRLENITTRLESRIETESASGVDTSRAHVPLIEAKRKLAEARSLLEKAKSNAESGLLSDSPRTRFMEARNDFRTARQSIREAFMLIQESIAELRDSSLAYEINRRNLGAVPESLAQ